LLIGIAGSFIGYHLATIVARSSPPMRRFHQPDAIKPGEPNPANTPMRMCGVKRS
jgi:hypothetical protein